MNDVKEKQRAFQGITVELVSVKEISDCQGQGYKWVKGQQKFANESDVQFGAKVYMKPSKFGIDGGRIVKFYITRNHKLLSCYDRGWDIEVAEDLKPLYHKVLATYN